MDKDPEYLKAYSIISFIKTALGENNVTIKVDKENGCCTVIQGTKHINRYIYTAGDCARFAKLLAMSFPQYDPEILLVRYSSKKQKYDKYLWHHAIVKFGDMYADAYGIYWEDVAKIRFDLDGKVYNIKSLDAPVLNGTMSAVKLSDTIFGTKIPIFHLSFVNLNTSHPKLVGYNGDIITALSKLFENQSDPDFWDNVCNVMDEYRYLELSAYPGLLRA